MIRLIVVVLVGALLWMLWWALGHTAYEKGLATSLDEMERNGWRTEFTNLNTAGFPNRFDTTATDLRVTDPSGDITWTAPKVQILSLAYKPHQIIAVLPDTHEIDTPFESFEINHEDARASLYLKPNTKLALNEARLIVEKLRIASTRGWQIDLDQARFAAESISDENDRFRVGAEFLDLGLPADLRMVLDPDETLPPQIRNARLDAELTFDRPVLGRPDERGDPRVQNVDLRDLSVVWADMELRADGDMTVNSDGRPEGEINLRAKQWRRIFEFAVSGGLIAPTSVETVRNGLELLSGGGDTIETSLQVTNGIAWLGLVPLGPVELLMGQ